MFYNLHLLNYIQNNELTVQRVDSYTILEAQPKMIMIIIIIVMIIIMIIQI